MFAYDNDHLEDYDSAQGDVELDSRGATVDFTTHRLLQTGVLSSDHDEYDESIRRGIRNAETQPNDETEKSPGAIMDAIMNGGGYSVTTGRMDHMLERGLSGPTIDVEDTYTYDGSTITSAHDISHKRNAQQHSVVDFNPQAAAAAAAMNPYHPQHALHVQQQQLKANLSKETEFTSDSSKTANSTLTEKSRMFCFGLGKLGIVLILLAVLAVSIAVILFLLLGNNQDTPAPPSSACCRGEFEVGWGGREICNAQGACCVVCSSSIVDSNPNANTGDDPGASTEPETDAPASNPTTLAPEKPITTQAPADESQQTTPEPTQATTTTEPTAAATTGEPTASPTTAAPTSAPTSSPTLAPTTEAPTAPPTPDYPCCIAEPAWADDYIGRVRCGANPQGGLNDFAIDPTIGGDKCCKVCVLK